MEGHSLTEWIEREFQAFGRTPPSNLLSSALQISIFQLLMSGISNGTDEESFSGAMFGAFCSTCGYCAPSIPLEQRHGLSWRRHNKNGKEGLSEKNTGADFALIIRLSDNVARAAVFQAKNGQSNIGSFDATHISPETDTRPPEPQFLRLREYCKRILLSIDRGGDKGIEEISWAHYLVYESFGIYSVPLSSLVQVNERVNSGANPGTIRYKQLHHSNFVDLLDRGCNQAEQDADGWLYLSSKEDILSFAENAIDLFDIYEARSDVRFDWTPIRKDVPLSRSAIAKKIKKSLHPGARQTPANSRGSERADKADEAPVAADDTTLSARAPAKGPRIG